MPSARSPGMAVRRDQDVDHTQRVERIEHIEERGPAAAPPQRALVNVTTASPVWTVTRVVTLVFTVLEVLLLLRFTFKLLGANQGQALVATLYAVTEPLVRPFQGIFAVSADSPLDLAALLAIVFLFLVAALIVALVRALTTRSA